MALVTRLRIPANAALFHDFFDHVFFAGLRVQRFEIQEQGWHILHQCILNVLASMLLEVGILCNMQDHATNHSGFRELTLEVKKVHKTRFVRSDDIKVRLNPSLIF